MSFEISENPLLVLRFHLILALLEICNDASTTQYKSYTKPTEYSKNKILSRLGEMRMREKPFENATIHSYKNNLYLNEFSHISDLRKVSNTRMAAGRFQPFGIF